MSHPSEVAARRLYDALAARDPQALLRAMTEDFVGDVSEGMPGPPGTVGGRHEGREAMLHEVWGPIFGAYDVTPEVDRYLPCGDDEVVAIGRYRGSERTTGRSLDARFAHVLEVRDGRVSALQQITDTRRWTGEAA